MKKRHDPNKRLKRFYVGFSTWLVTCTGLFIINGFTYHGNWWAVWPFFGWGIAVLLQGIATFQSEVLSSNTGKIDQSSLSTNEEFLNFEQLNEQVVDSSKSRKSKYSERDFV